MNKLGQNIKNSSYRDVDGFVFYEDNTFKRALSAKYLPNYKMLMESGLCQHLVDQNLLIKHQESGTCSIGYEDYHVIVPKQLSFISYPYEWSFDQFRDAALCILNVNIESLKYNMICKDASPYNVQYDGKNFVFIDTSSFVEYIESEPWIAYDQFCSLIFAPLVIQKYYGSVGAHHLSCSIDGYDLSYVSKILPIKSFLSIMELLHIHIHSLVKNKHSRPRSVEREKKKTFVSKTNLLSMLIALKDYISNLDVNKVQSEWGAYYENTNYNDDSARFKRTIVSDWLKLIKPKSLLDAGCNSGEITLEIAHLVSDYVLAFDYDPVAVNKLYQDSKNSESIIHPFKLDLINPSPAIGWNCSERLGVFDRISTDCTLFLALIHHIVISRNVPLLNVAEMLSRLSKHLIIEFVDIEDSMLRSITKNVTNFEERYNRTLFESMFLTKYTIVKKVKILNTERYLYWMERKNEHI